MAQTNPILHNFGWKLLSLALAALTWLTIETAFQKQEVAAKEPAVITTSRKPFPAIPITLLTSPTNTNQFKLTPQTVAIELGGEEQELKTLQLREIQAFVDVSDAQDEKQFRKIIQIRVPKDLTVLLVAPTNASVERVTATR